MMNLTFRPTANERVQSSNGAVIHFYGVHQFHTKTIPTTNKINYIVLQTRVRADKIFYAQTQSFDITILVDEIK